MAPPCTVAAGVRSYRRRSLAVVPVARRGRRLALNNRVAALIRKCGAVLGRPRSRCVCRTIAIGRCGIGRGAIRRAVLAAATGRRPEAVGTRGSTRRSLSAKRGGLLVVQGLYRTRRLDRGGCVVWRVIARRTEVRQPAVHRSDSGRVLQMTGRRNEPRQRERRFDVRLRLATGVFGPHVILAAVLQAHMLVPRLLGSRRMLGPGVLLARLFLARLFLTPYALF